MGVCCNECHLAAQALRGGMTVEQARSLITPEIITAVATNGGCNSYALVQHSCCERCSPPPPPPFPPPPASGNEEDNTVTIIAIVAAAVVFIAIIVAVVVLKKKQALPSTGTATPNIHHSSQSSVGPRGAKFDPNTGQPIPKFDPVTGVQNWSA